jgi:hypothetical protein
MKDLYSNIVEIMKNRELEIWLTGETTKCTKETYHPKSWHEAHVPDYQSTLHESYISRDGHA